MSERTLIQPDVHFIKYLKKHGGDSVKKCYQCATCSVVCSLSPESNAFPRKEMISAGWGQKESVISNPDVWLCHGCTDCSTYCPRGAKPADVLASIRSYIIEFFAVPKFMGTLAQNPKYLALLILIPALIIFAISFVHLDGNYAQLTQGSIVFDRLFPHSIVDPLFIFGNILAFTFAGIALTRFWKNLTTIAPAENKKGFVSVFIKTVIEIFTHKNFNLCSRDSTRFWGHLFIFYGFAGAFLTTALAAVADIVFHYKAPIPIFSPIKILGNLSGILMVVGTVVVSVRRLTNKDKTSSTYFDWSLILFIFGVAITGLFTQYFRLFEIPELAYSTYYVHMVLLFCLLWYAPFSKLAHMFYRTLALVYLKMNDRNKKQTIFNISMLLKFFLKL
ncbi:MAG: quinone-interacting membrane-bound oxidoreductase complex subunit QmoC [Ignavibacteria bacterium]|nr:quinone-interacting membrane-bound oxidoreductase complex subunit QmoC [Ignavibacteria bacterium]MBT8391258.1 quinone-interacting membrane-bound oxidoreductase complex subunit QmoC [Ignavibacteria bacterium]NNJ54297.1 quinone-interacting membrane-bound oxidoreductase complex subunit QmoC [Ignavibacteriaceae bacterium]NNL22594.1 quinone-interacting membrane-bound oxidoreductase complex subunit QmoC [Ignavibacteriaceae bacterium]